MVKWNEARKVLDERYADCIVNGHQKVNTETDSCEYCHMKLITTPYSDYLERSFMDIHSPITLEEQQIVDEKRRAEIEHHIKYYSIPATAKIVRELSVKKS